MGLGPGRRASLPLPEVLVGSQPGGFRMAHSARQNEHRPGVLAAALLLAAVGGFLVSHWAHPEPPQGRRYPEEIGPATDRPSELSPILRGAGPVGIPGSTSQASSDRAGLTVEVVDADSGAPVKGARVTLTVDTMADAGSQTLSGGRRIATLQTDHAGRCFLDAALTQSPGAAVLVWATGFPAQTKVVGTEDTRVRVELRAAGVISGSVETVNGERVPGAVVRAVPSVLSDADARETLPLAPDQGGVARCSVSTTDDAGSFRIGVQPDDYRLFVEADGYVSVPENQLEDMRRQISGVGRYFRPGDSDVRLVVRPTRYVVVSLRDANTREIVEDRSFRVAVEGTDGIAEQVELERTAATLPLLLQGQRRNFVVGVIALQTAKPKEEQAVLRVEAPGYTVTRTPVRLLTRTQLENTDVIDTILLAPLPPESRGDLQVSVTRDDGWSRGGARPWLVVPKDRTIIRGTQVEGNAWLFRLLPAGEQLVSLSDGYSRPCVFRVTVPSQGRAFERVALEPLTGLALRVFDESGRRVLDARFSIKARSQAPPDIAFVDHLTTEEYTPSTKSARNVLPVSEWSPELGKLSEFRHLLSLWPGGFDITVWREGYVAVPLEQALSRGEVATGDVVLKRRAP